MEEDNNKTNLDELDNILSQFRAAGGFEEFEGRLWQHAARQELRAAARALMPESHRNIKIRVFLSVRDIWNDGGPSLLQGDLSDFADAKLKAVVVGRFPGEGF